MPLIRINHKRDYIDTVTQYNAPTIEEGIENIILDIFGDFHAAGSLEEAEILMDFWDLERLEITYLPDEEFATISMPGDEN